MRQNNVMTVIKTAVIGAAAGYCTKAICEMIVKCDTLQKANDLEIERLQKDKALEEERLKKERDAEIEKTKADRDVELERIKNEREFEAFRVKDQLVRDGLCQAYDINW